MRIQTSFGLSTDWLTKDYRRIFMSLIKSFLSYEPVLYSMLYGNDMNKKKVNKPFTFSIHFPDFKAIEGNKILCGDRVSLFFSSNDEILITSFYNGLKKKRKTIIGENQPIVFELTGLHLLPQNKIQSGKVEFRTLSPVLVNLKRDNLNYISPVHPEFDKSFRAIISNQAQELNHLCLPDDIKIEINTMKKLPLTHYNQTMTSWLGTFTMEAPLDILQLVYDTGIGVRRSQGFGMLEILKQYSNGRR